MRSLTIDQEQPIDSRAVFVSMSIVPVSSYLVVTGLLPFAGLFLSVLICPVVAVLISDKASPVFVGASAGALALILSFAFALGWAWILWSDLSTTYLADLTYLSFLFGVPAAVGGVIGASAIGGVLGKVTHGAHGLLRGDVRIEFEF